MALSFFVKDDGSNFGYIMKPPFSEKSAHMINEIFGFTCGVFYAMMTYS